MECADRGITLVKEEKGVLPLSPAATKRVLLYGLEGVGEFLDGTASESSNAARFKSLLEREGFAVEMFVAPKGMEGAMRSYADWVASYDLMVYVASLGTRSNQTTVRIDWAPPMGSNVPIYMSAIPTIFISLENPYHLLDVPRVRTYINTYGASDTVLQHAGGQADGQVGVQGCQSGGPVLRKMGREAVGVATRAVIFDLDGVIVSTDAMHYQAWRSVADDEGIYFDEKINNRLRGVSRMESLEIILERAARPYSQAEKQTLAETKNARYVELLQGLSPSDVPSEVIMVLAGLSGRRHQDRRGLVQQEHAPHTQADRSARRFRCRRRRQRYRALQAGSGRVPGRRPPARGRARRIAWWSRTPRRASRRRKRRACAPPPWETRSAAPRPTTGSKGSATCWPCWAQSGVNMLETKGPRIVKVMTIAALEQATGVARSTIHFYIREGLLPQPAKTAASRSLYSEDHVRLLGRIGELKSRAARSLRSRRS